MTCNDLRLGGTLSSSGLTGGTSINSTALMVSDWSDILGTAGLSAQLQQVNGRTGGFISGDRLGLARFPTLNMRITKYGPNLTLVEPSFDEQKQANTDDFLALVTDPAGNYLEVDMADGTSRFIYVYDLDPAPMRQPEKDRTIAVPLASPNAYWKEGGQEDTDTIASADTMTVGGNRSVYDAVLVFAGDGTFTHSTLGWAIEVTGSGGAVTVDLGNRTVTEGGNPALNRIRRTPATGAGGVWGWFTPGSNSVTSDVSVVVTWRSSWA